MHFTVVNTAVIEWMDKWNKNGQIDDWMEGQTDRLKVNSQRFFLTSHNLHLAQIVPHRMVFQLLDYEHEVKWDCTG